MRARWRRRGCGRLALHLRHSLGGQVLAQLRQKPGRKKTWLGVVWAGGARWVPLGPRLQGPHYSATALQPFVLHRRTVHRCSSSSLGSPGHPASQPDRSAANLRTWKIWLYSTTASLCFSASFSPSTATWRGGRGGVGGEEGEEVNGEEEGARVLAGCEVPAPNNHASTLGTCKLAAPPSDPITPCPPDPRHPPTHPARPPAAPAWPSAPPPAPRGSQGASSAGSGWSP